jgi:hypothetical protein
MKKIFYKTVELSRKELMAIEGGSLSEVASAIWEFIGFSFTLNSRVMTKNAQYQENFYNH